MQWRRLKFAFFIVEKTFCSDQLRFSRLVCDAHKGFGMKCYEVVFAEVEEFCLARTAQIYSSAIILALLKIFRYTN